MTDTKSLFKHFPLPPAYPGYYGNTAGGGGGNGRITTSAGGSSGGWQDDEEDDDDYPHGHIPEWQRSYAR